MRPGTGFGPVPPFRLPARTLQNQIGRNRPQLEMHVNQICEDPILSSFYATTGQRQEGGIYVLLSYRTWCLFRQIRFSSMICPRVAQN